MNIDQEMKIQVQYMLERFLEQNLAVVDTANERCKIVGIPFVCQNIVGLLVK